MALREFEKLNELYSAIKEIDKILNSEKIDQKIEDLLIAVKDIDTKEFNKEYVDQIILGFRSAILEIYKNDSTEINKNIDNPGALYYGNKSALINSKNQKKLEELLEKGTLMPIHSIKDKGGAI